MDPPFFLFLYTQNQQCGTVWNLHTALAGKIPYCENVYKRLGTPAIFKISPLVSPDFDYTLENRGYEIQHTTDVMTLCLRDARLTAAFDDVQFTEAIPDSWIFSLFDLKK